LDDGLGGLAPNTGRSHRDEGFGGRAPNPGRSHGAAFDDGLGGLAANPGRSGGAAFDDGLGGLAATIGRSGDARVASIANLDAGDAGTLFALPLIPMGGREVTEALAIVDGVVERPYITLNGIGRIFEMVCNVVFDRRDRSEVTRAHVAIDLLLQRMTAAGYPPYRVSISQMAIANTDTPLHRAMRDLLDPRGVLSPGRYAGEHVATSSRTS
jgi:hypothetical protein